MSCRFPALLLIALAASPVSAAGLLLPSDGGTPLAMVDHKVTVRIHDQVSVTRVEQTFRNPTSRALEATYIFPVPAGASVNQFTMWVDGKETRGELVEADKARAVYIDIVRRLQDPGLLEYMGGNVLRLRVFPVPANGDQKVAVAFTAVNKRDSGLIEYTYPLRTDGKAARTLEKFTLDVSLEAQHKIQSVYSPTHAVKVRHKSDHHADVSFEEKGAALEKDLQLYYSVGDKDVGLTALTYRPDAEQDGHFLLLIAPRAELAQTQRVARDMVFVLDTSGSMAGAKMDQARKALKYCLDRLPDGDRFAVLNFATTVNHHREGLTNVTRDSIAGAKKWVDDLEATGGTAIDEALRAALDLRSHDRNRSFTVVFFTDGQPTIGETNPDKIIHNVLDRNTIQTRIFTFGVGDDVNAVLLDRLAEETRAVSSYIRPEEDIEVKVSALQSKISHPVLTDLKLTVGDKMTLKEVYPAQLPDLFHGGQLVVLGRYSGKGHAAVTLTGKVGDQEKQFVYEVDFSGKTGDDKNFLADLWARRKVGYLLDQIRRNGEKKELVDEVVKLAKKHGITTPYTSYLVVPDNAPVVNRPSLPPVSGVPIASSPYGWSFGSIPLPPGAAPGSFAPPMSGLSAAPVGAAAPVTVAAPTAPAPVNASIQYAPSFAEPSQTGSGTIALDAMNTADDPGVYTMRQGLARGEAQTGKVGVDLAVQLNELRTQDQVGKLPSQTVQGRTLRQVGQGWIDDHFDGKGKVVKVQAMSRAYFRILERHPEMKEVFRLGTQVAWVTPTGAALVIESGKGQETMSDSDIDALFMAKK
jgi:Ca-activated chloride channel family protein